MKRTGRVLAILLALAMLLSVTAFAATTTSTWYGYGGDTTTHNAAVDVYKRQSQRPSLRR